MAKTLCNRMGTDNKHDPFWVQHYILPSSLLFPDPFLLLRLTPQDAAPIPSG